MRAHYSFTLAMALTATGASAQCTFTPTISPANPILCPDATDTLTTQVYEVYQWYKDGSAIPGATAQTLVVEQATDAGSTFSVSATLDGCTEMSAPVLVDGWVFLLPYVIHGGGVPINQGPDLQFCEGDTLTLTLSPGYTENIVWTNNGNPIPGATAPVLTVTTDGNYSVSAAPGECPNSIMGIGVVISATFLPNWQPDIVDMDNGELCAYPSGGATQWYLIGSPIDTGTCIQQTAMGPYTVFVDYGQACQVISEPFMSDGISEPQLPKPSISPIPATTSVQVKWPAVAGRNTPWLLTDGTGRTVLTGVIPASGQSQLDVRGLAAGNYMLLAPRVPVRPARVVIAR
ncbi:MAG: hypothetical protein JST38_03440 [Bacteroidetes bacterium]|nr:hypothetical protein [Bacteroidota bacterium]